MAKKDYLLYRIRCTRNGMEYYGQTGNGFDGIGKLIRFWDGHLKELLVGTHTNPAMQEDFNRYRQEAFVCEIIQDGVQSKYVDQLENGLILLSIRSGNSYNVLDAKGHAWEKDYDAEEFYRTLIPFTRTGGLLEKEVDGYLCLFSGIPEKLKKQLRKLKDCRYYPGMDNTWLIEGLRDRVRQGAKEASVVRISLPGLREGGGNIEFRPCLSNSGPGIWDSERHTYRRRR